MSEDSSPIMAGVQEMAEQIKQALVDAEKFEAGNDTAGTRVRKAMQLLKQQAQMIRQQVSAIRAEKE